MNNLQDINKAIDLLASHPVVFYSINWPAFATKRPTICGKLTDEEKKQEAIHEEEVRQLIEAVLSANPSYFVSLFHSFKSYYEHRVRRTWILATLTRLLVIPDDYEDFRSFILYSLQKRQQQTIKAIRIINPTGVRL